MADLKELPKAIKKELIGVSKDCSRNVVLATITLPSADLIERVAQEVLANLSNAAGASVVIGYTLIDTSCFAAFYVK